jgi:flagellar protein FliO/FliZ
MIVSSITDNAVFQFLTVTFIFVVVLALTYFTTRWIGSYQKKQMSYGAIKIIESYRLSGSKVMNIVKAGDKCFLIAVCKDTVTLIGEVSEESLELKKTEDETESFGTVFSRFKVQHKDETDDEHKKEDSFDNN